MTNGDHIQASAAMIAIIAPVGVCSRVSGSPVNRRAAWLTRPKVGS